MPRKGLPRMRRAASVMGFNEAGAVMPRKGSGLSSFGARSSGCFNEAGAVMPRKGRNFTIIPPIRPSFNEAGAVMPRKGRRSVIGLVGSAPLQ